MNSESWTTRLLERSPCLHRAPHGPSLARIAAAALASVDPHAQIRRHTHRLRKPRGEAAVVGEFVFDLADDPDAPREGEHARLWIFGAGKASAAMAEALVERFGERVAGGAVIVKHGAPRASELDGAPAPRIGDSRVELLAGDHPIPGPATAAASARMRALAERVGPRDLVLCPISGGASALLSEPLLPAEAWAELSAGLLAQDVSIQAFNKLRRRFDRLKAGGLARLLSPATVVGLIISDVVGDELALVGSGPTVYADASDEQDYRELLVELEPRLAQLSAPLRARLAAPPAFHPWPQLPNGLPQGVHQVLIARNGDAREAACRQAHSEGLDSIVLLPALGGLAADEGRRLGALLRELPAGLPISPPACFVTGGETTVELGGEHAQGGSTGIGGRNQELALAAIEALDGVHDAALMTLATDGEDGPTDAAGAVVWGDSASRAAAAGIDIGAGLAAHDSHSIFAALGDLVRTGASGTNVCDLAFLVRR